jgi:hypothetical protein
VNDFLCCQRIALEVDELFHFTHIIDFDLMSSECDCNKEAPRRAFTFLRPELQDITDTFLGILNSPEAISKEWLNLDGIAGNGIVSLAELDFWLCVRFPILRHKAAIKMAFYRVLKLSNSQNGYIQKQSMFHLMVVIYCSNQALNWWKELPSKSGDEILKWLASKKVETPGNRLELEMAPNIMVQSLQTRVLAAIDSKKSMFCVDFEFFCDLVASFKTTAIDVMYCNLTPCHVMPLDLSAKPRCALDIQKRIREKIKQATREQDCLCASALPYMKSRPRTGRSNSSRASTSHSHKHTSANTVSWSFLPDASATSTRPSTTECPSFHAPKTSISNEIKPSFDDKERPNTSSSSVLSLMTSMTPFAGSLEACQSAGEVVPGILYAKSAELRAARRTYLNAFGFQHPHTGCYFHSPHHNDLLSEKHIAGMHAVLPDYKSRLNESPLKSPIFQLMRKKPGENPLAFSTDRSPSKFLKDKKQALHPRRPWNTSFAAASNTNGSFSMSSTEVAINKNRNTITRALSPTSAMLLSPAASPNGKLKSVAASSRLDAKKLPEMNCPEWDHSKSTVGFFERVELKPYALFASAELL